MASQGYRDWLKAGQLYALIQPAKAVQATLRGYGLTVYDYPNDAHLQAAVPEDHTPFSVTGWPGTNARWNARALDVMPRSNAYEHRKENADIARQLIRDRDAGHPGAMWIKYLNWTDEGGNCRQERWTDSAAPLRRITRASNDRGHIHVSGRSDADDDDRADTYDPIARMRAGSGSAATTGDDDMDFNQSAKLDGLFNAADTVSLDTDGTVDGKGAKGSFSVPLVALIKSQHAETMSTLAKVAEAAGIDPAELDAIRASAAAGVAAALEGGAERLIAAITEAVTGMPIDQMNNDDIEAAVRRVFADAATPDA